MTHLGESRVALRRQGVTRKSLVTPNEFVSHMIEHLAWRLGCSVDVHWTNDDWRHLGVELGQEVGRLGRVRSDAAALGMIDDGSCEVEVHVSEDGGATLVASPHVDLGWFLGLRCEQLRTGQPLVSLLDGLGAGSGLSIRLNVASLEDPRR